MSASDGTSRGRSEGPSPRPEAWVPDGDRPLVLPLARRRPFLLAVGLALIVAAVLVVRQVVLYPESVQVPVPVAVVLLTLVIAFLAGLGGATVWAFVRAPRQVVTIDGEGLVLGGSTLRLSWDDVEAVAVRVVASRPSSTHLAPRGPMSNVLVFLLWRPVGEDASSEPDTTSLAVILPDPFTQERLLTSVPFTADLDVPVARDLDTALRHFAGPAYRPPQ